MKITARLFCALGILTCWLQQSHAASATNQPTGFRLIVELQDGSKIIGKSGDDNFQFRSDVLGEMKLPLERIRSIECSAKTNATRLITTNGDTLTVQFATKVVRVKTAFGNFKLPVNLIRHMQMSPMGKPGQMREGLVALWPAEGNGNDSMGNNNGILQGGMSFGPGEVGQGFVFDGFSAYAKVPASSSLDVGQGSGLTIECWINPANPNSVQPVFEWNNNNGQLSGSGAQIWLTAGGPDELHANVIDTGGNNHHMGANNVMTTNNFQHIALTYDKATGVAVLYRNGVAVTTQTLGSFTPQTSFDLYMGLRPSGSFSGIYFQGMLDEVSLYNRALTASEIQSDYEAGNSSN